MEKKRMETNVIEHMNASQNVVYLNLIHQARLISMMKMDFQLESARLPPQSVIK